MLDQRQRRWADVAMLGQRRRRWSNIKAAHKKYIYRSTEKTVFYIYMGKAQSH